MIKLLNTTVFICLMAAGLFNSATAQKLNYSADVSLVSDYIFRGQSISDGSPALQSGFYIENDKGWRYRFWGSTYDFNGDTDTKGEFSLDYHRKVYGYMEWSMGVKQYVYESEDRASREWFVGLAMFGVEAKYHRDEELDTQYFDVNYQYQWNDEWKLRAHYGITKQTYLDDTSDDFWIGADYQWLPELNVFVQIGGQNEDWADQDTSFGVLGATYLFDF